MIDSQRSERVSPQRRLIAIGVTALTLFGVFGIAPAAEATVKDYSSCQITNRKVNNSYTKGIGRWQQLVTAWTITVKNTSKTRSVNCRVKVTYSPDSVCMKSIRPGSSSQIGVATAPGQEVKEAYEC